MISGAVGAVRVLERFDSDCIQEGRAPDAVAQRLHQHPKVGSRMHDRTRQFSANLSDRHKHMLDPNPHLGDPLIVHLRPFGEPAIGSTPSLKLAWIANTP